VENLTAFLNSYEGIRDSLYVIRKNAIIDLKLEPSLQYGVIKPIYPAFELPCPSCYLVNEQPGNCEHCGA